MASIDLKPNKVIEMTTYASIYEYNGHIVGGNGQLEEWEPGVSSLKDKVWLINEGKINK